MKKIKNSQRLLEKARHLIPSCSQTFSKCPNQFPRGIAPIYLKRGKGCIVEDVDGNRYIDYATALGPVTLGYAYPAVDNAIKKQLKDGIIFSLMHPKEVELAEMLKKIIPCAEMVRYGKNGSDATSGAIRAARAYTGRERVACCGYHGWQDWYIATTTRDAGIPISTKKLISKFEYNNIDSLKKIFSRNKNKIAAVIMEPIGVIEPQNNFLSQVKNLVHKNGAILIFDEVVTSFRVDLGGAQKYYNVVPDLACIGKGMANGMPISAVVGKKKIMKIFDEIFFSFTFGGEALSLAASLATINEMQKKNTIPFTWKQGKKIKDGYNAIAKKYRLENITDCIGLPPRTMINYRAKSDYESRLMKTFFQQECIKRGVLFVGYHNICFSHKDRHISKTLQVYDEVMKLFRKAIDNGDIRKRLQAKVIEPVFRKI